MSEIKIGSDGSVIKDNVPLKTNEGVISSDGTIVGTDDTTPARPVVSRPPVSPLRTSNPNNDPGNQTALQEKEYDLQVIEGRIKHAVSIPAVVATIVLLIIGIASADFRILLFIAAITGFFAVRSFLKRIELQKEKDKLVAEIETMRQGLT